MYLFLRISRIVKEQGFFNMIEKIYKKLASLDTNRHNRKFNHLYRQKRWTDATKFGETIIKKNTTNSELFRKMAACYYEMGNYNVADNYIKKSLNFKFNGNLQDLIYQVESKVFDNTDKIHSKYLYLGGHGNLGIIEHKVADHGLVNYYITKIVPCESSNEIKKESFFNRIIREQYEQYKPITPKMIKAFELESEALNFITFQKIIGTTPDKKNISQVIKINEIIQTIKYDELVELSQEKDFAKKNNVYSLMHKKGTNQEILLRLQKKFSGHPDLCSLIKSLETIIIDMKMYERLEPSVHYSLCHNDFRKENIILNLSNDKLYVIDWALFDIGIRNQNLVKFFGSLNLNFEEINKNYLKLIDDNDYDNNVIKLFFVFSLIIWWLERTEAKNINQFITTNIEPAVKYLDLLAYTINKMEK